MLINIKASLRNLYKGILLILLVPLILLLLPFAFIAGLIEMPISKRRREKLKKILENDWLPRKKYIYIGNNTFFPLTEFLWEKVVPKYKEHLIIDEWVNDQGNWKSSEPDKNKRVTTLWQDIGGDYDGDVMLIIATYDNDFMISKEKGTFHQFTEYIEDKEGNISEKFVYYNGEKIESKKAKKIIIRLIEDSISHWKLST